MSMAQQSPDSTDAMSEFELLPLVHPCESTFSRYFSSPLQKGNKLMDNLSSYGHRSVLESTPSANCHSMTAFSTQALARAPHGKSLRWFVVALVILLLISGGWGAVTAFKYAQTSL